MKFAKRCNQKILSVYAFSFFPELQTRYNEIPIKKYNTVHTGPKIQFGGLNAGFSNPRYQVGIAGAVKTEPSIPTDSVIAIDKIKILRLLTLIIL